ncbi:hypothetical protein HG531_010892 [Fusarium graminearum]|nr:hypothetical protein HG531_010892 [Fusarium graminearum]
MELSHKSEQSSKSNSGPLGGGERGPDRNAHGQRVEAIVENPEVRPDVGIGLDKVCTKDGNCGGSGDEGLDKLEEVDSHDVLVFDVLQKLCIGQSLPVHLVGRVAVEGDHISGVVIQISEGSFG